MITDRHGIKYPDIITALRMVRKQDARWEANPLPTDLSDLRASIDAIIASASGAVAAASEIGGERAGPVLAKARGLVGELAG